MSESPKASAVFASRDQGNLIYMGCKTHTGYGRDVIPGFIHLHVHSHYSFLHAAGSPAEYVDAAVQQRAPALALTDHLGLWGPKESFYLEITSPEDKWHVYGWRGISGSGAVIGQGGR